MRKMLPATLVALCFFLTAGAETITVRQFRHVGPFPVQTPFLVDSVDVQSKAFDAKSFLDASFSKEGLAASTPCAGEDLPACDRLSVGLV